ncbi:hypothetical protein AAG747_11990 [Rapidithrix thailandica]|uniref:Uncharacterized protein n=1 Tax=Rapidithrix thailandica TaxID=413964 RepID=A0AAW9SCL9_9BACT
MSQKQLEVELNKLESKLQLLLKAYQKQQAELAQLTHENQELKLKLSKQNEQLNYLKYNSEIATIVNSLAEGRMNPSELKARISEYIKELDNCIAYLNKSL